MVIVTVSCTVVGTATVTVIKPDGAGAWVFWTTADVGALEDVEVFRVVGAAEVDGLADVVVGFAAAEVAGAGTTEPVY
jgi:hypothetical protein